MRLLELEMGLEQLVEPVQAFAQFVLARDRARDPGARWLVLEQAATAIPDASADEVAAAMLALG